MVFRRFFDRGAKGENAPEQVTISDTEPVEESATTDEMEAEEPEVDAEQDDTDLLTRARAVLPMGTSTGSKRVVNVA